MVYLFHVFGCKHGKWTKKMPRLYKTIVILVKRFKVVAKCCLKLIIFHGGSIFFFKYSNAEY